MSNDLSGLRVVITRPWAQAAQWSESLRSQGASTTLVPLLELSAVAQDEQIQAVKNIVLDFDLYQKAIFVSQNAVEFGMVWLENYWPQLPQGVAFFAVGETTVRHLQQHGVRVSALTASASGAMNSESLLQASELQQVAEEKIVIFRGCGGRGHMGDILRERGARVDYCELYQRHLPDNAAAQLIAAFTDASVWQCSNVIALHSGESLQHYRLVLQQLALEAATATLAEQIRGLPVLVPGQRVAELAKAAGFARIIIAENATDRSMQAALQTL